MHLLQVGLRLVMRLGAEIDMPVEIFGVDACAVVAHGAQLLEEAVRLQQVHHGSVELGQPAEVPLRA